MKRAVDNNSEEMSGVDIEGNESQVLWAVSLKAHLSSC